METMYAAIWVIRPKVYGNWVLVGLKFKMLGLPSLEYIKIVCDLLVIGIYKCKENTFSFSMEVPLRPLLVCSN